MLGRRSSPRGLKGMIASGVSPAACRTRRASSTARRERSAAFLSAVPSMLRLTPSNACPPGCGSVSMASERRVSSAGSTCPGRYQATTRTAAGITLVLENHYKDNYWQYPEFAQKMDVFCELVDRIHSPHFGVNYDPSNTFLAGEDPLDLLDASSIASSPCTPATATWPKARSKTCAAKRIASAMPSDCGTARSAGAERLRRDLPRPASASASTAGSASKTASTASTSFDRSAQFLRKKSGSIGRIATAAILRASPRRDRRLRQPSYPDRTSNGRQEHGNLGVAPGFRFALREQALEQLLPFGPATFMTAPQSSSN